jgi:hypothetical protein
MEAAVREQHVEVGREYQAGGRSFWPYRSDVADRQSLLRIYG